MCERERERYGTGQRERERESCLYRAIERVSNFPLALPEEDVSHVKIATRRSDVIRVVLF